VWGVGGGPPRRCHPMGYPDPSMGYPLRIDGLPPSHRWVTSFASMGYPVRIDGLPPSHRWVTPFASMGYLLRIDGLPPSHRWVAPFASMGYPLRIDGLPPSHRWVTDTASLETADSRKCHGVRNVLLHGQLRRCQKMAGLRVGMTARHPPTPHPLLPTPPTYISNSELTESSS
jgi:hypothetical protein